VGTILLFVLSITGILFITPPAPSYLKRRTLELPFPLLSLLSRGQVLRGEIWEKFTCYLNSYHITPPYCQALFLRFLEKLTCYP
jgi:hypothetical protein